MALFPEQARLAAKGDHAALRKSVRGMTGIGFAIGIPGAVLAWFLFPTLIPALFTDEFENVVEPARIMLVAAVFQFAIGSWAKSLPAAIGKPRLRTMMSAVYMGVSVGLTATLATGLESTAGAIGTTVAAVSTLTAWWFLAERILRNEAVLARDKRAADSPEGPPPEAQMAPELEPPTGEWGLPP
jgi:O-antigen/teichoic acid export membrane protein